MALTYLGKKFYHSFCFRLKDTALVNKLSRCVSGSLVYIKICISMREGVYFLKLLFFGSLLCVCKVLQVVSDLIILTYDINLTFMLSF